MFAQNKKKKNNKGKNMQNKKTLGRPNTLDTKNVSVTLPQEMIKKIDQLPTNRSETIRLALEGYLKTK